MKYVASLALGLGLVLLSGHAHSQAPKTTPKLDPVADTKLIMVGLASANYKGLERLLRDPPKDDQAWIFARGQALLIAETGNLLMIRPPRNQGEGAWHERAMELRFKASQLAKTLSLKDFNASRAEFVGLANTCNRCHQAFRVPVQIEPFAEAANQPRDAGGSRVQGSSRHLFSRIPNKIPPLPTNR